MLRAAVTESCACGVLLVTTNAGGIPYLVRHEESALLTNCGDYAGLARNAIRLLEDPELAQRKVERMPRMRVLKFEESDVTSAIELHRLHQLSFWDSMIVHAARIGGAQILFSEDLQSGSSWGKVRLLNPFAEI